MISRFSPHLLPRFGGGVFLIYTHIYTHTENPTLKSAIFGNAENTDVVTLNGR